MTTGTMIEGKAICKSFGAVEVLSHLDFRFERGSRCAVLGQSGTGKTTLLRLIAGLDIPEAGELSIDGRNMLGVLAHNRGISFMFQSPALWPHMTLLQNALFVMDRPDRPRVQGLLERVGITDLACRYPHQVSGGQARRAALVRALAPRKPILLLDEPAAHLGPELVEAVWRLIEEESSACGATVLAAVHVREHADRLSGPVLDLDRHR